MRERMAYSARPEVPPTMTVTRGWVVRTVVFREVMVGGGGGGDHGPLGGMVRG